MCVPWRSVTTSGKQDGRAAAVAHDLQSSDAELATGEREDPLAHIP